MQRSLTLLKEDQEDRGAKLKGSPSFETDNSSSVQNVKVSFVLQFYAYPWNKISQVSLFDKKEVSILSRITIGK